MAGNSPRWMYYYVLEQASFNFMAAVTICSDFGAPKNKVSHCFHCFPIYLPWSDGTRCHDLSVLNVELGLSLSSFTFIKRLFSISLLSAIRVVSSAYLRLMIFLPALGNNWQIWHWRKCYNACLNLAKFISFCLFPSWLRFLRPLGSKCTRV